MLYIYFPEWIKPEIIPGLPIRWYGLMYLVAFATAYFFYRKLVQQDELDMSDDDISNLFFWIIVGLIIGARVFSTLIYDQSGLYRAKPWLIFWPFAGGKFVGFQGMSYHGGLIGGIIGGYLFSLKYKKSFLEIADGIMAALPFGYTFGRIGNFINGELYGRVTTHKWGIIFPYAERFPSSESWVQDVAKTINLDISGMHMVNLPRHPSQLYEAFGEGILLGLIIWFFVRKVKKHDGIICGTYLIGYGLVRFIVEYFREPDVGLDFPLLLGDASPNYLFVSFFNFTTGQILCSLMILAGILVMIFTSPRFPWIKAKNSEK